MYSEEKTWFWTRLKGWDPGRIIPKNDKNNSCRICQQTLSPQNTSFGRVSYSYLDEWTGQNMAVKPSFL